MTGATPNLDAEDGAAGKKLSGAASPGVVYPAVIALLVWYFVTAVTATIGKSTMFDELFHLTGGYTYWMTRRLSHSARKRQLAATLGRYPAAVSSAESAEHG